ncbi:unnamed protein product, partial [Adineta steineri]
VKYSTGLKPYYVAVGQLNQDAYVDIVVINNGDNSISVFLGFGNGSFANQTKYLTGGSPTFVAVADFNDDTKLDIF